MLILSSSDLAWQLHVTQPITLAFLKHFHLALGPPHSPPWPLLLNFFCWLVLLLFPTLKYQNALRLSPYLSFLYILSLVDPSISVPLNMLRCPAFIF